MELLVPPIILNESNEITRSGDVSIFNSVSEAVAYLEPIDVKNGEYFAFDSQGSLLELTVLKEKSRLLGIFPITNEQIQIQKKKHSSNHSSVLASVIREYFTQIGPERMGLKSEFVEQAALGDLVQALQIFESKKP